MTSPDQDPTDPTEPAEDGFWSGDETSQTAAQTAESRRTSGADHPADDSTSADDSSVAGDPTSAGDPTTGDDG